MPVVQFSPDQVAAMLEWLENQRQAGLDLDDLIEGLQRGYFTVSIAKDSHERFTVQEEQKSA